MSDWIEWNGGECPVERGTVVDVKYRDGDIETGKALSCALMRSLFWTHDNSSADIIAYRLHKPEQEVPLTQQLAEAVKKRDKYSRKADKWAQRFADQAAEVNRIAVELEKEVEEATGCGCSITADERKTISIGTFTIDFEWADGAQEKLAAMCQRKEEIPADVDPDDPKTWREGDVVKAVTSRVSYITVGKEYEASGYDSVGDVIIECDDDGHRHSPASSEAKFRFVRRPSEQ